MLVVYSLFSVIADKLGISVYWVWAAAIGVGVLAVLAFLRPFG